ncbi:MAG TPA: NADPH-dependent FMN reductase [Thermoanaerobaculia bacterium]|nr:NADPH-dependent FMN reductase [Thermoanaerobaculia bacterium]
MATIIGISGSVRRGSYNAMLLAAAAETIPIEIASIADIPLYNADWNTEHGLPESVHALKERLANADGLLIATPEYNNSIPGVAKNAIDWLSRPYPDIPRVFGGLHVALMGATPGRGGTILAQAAWLPVLRGLGTRAFSGRSIYVSNAGALFDENGLRDEETRARVEKFAREFAELVASHPRQRT